jgi:hypothetical protein
MGIELLHADGKIAIQRDRQIDMTKLIVAFRSFLNAPKSALFFSASYGKCCRPDLNLSMPTNTERCRTYNRYLCYFYRIK